MHARTISVECCNATHVWVLHARIVASRSSRVVIQQMQYDVVACPSDRLVWYSPIFQRKTVASAKGHQAINAPAICTQLVSSSQ